jgi:hypothetical protein
MVKANLKLVTENILNSYRLMIACDLKTAPYIKFVTSDTLSDFDNILEWWASVGEKDEVHRVISNKIDKRITENNTVDDIFLFYIDQDGGEWMLTSD